MKYALIFVLCWTSAAVAAVAEPVRVNVAFNPPVSTFCGAILAEAFGRLDRPFSLRTHLPAERAIRQVDQGVDDADCMRVDGIKTLFGNLIQVPTPIFDVEFLAFTRKGFRLAPGWSGLKPHHVGAVKGWKLIELNVRSVGPRSFTQVGSADSLLRMLALGRIDVAALNRLDGLQTIRELGLADIEPAELSLAAVPLYFTLHRSQGTLARQLDTVFLAMKRDGSWQAIERTVFSTRGG